MTSGGVLGVELIEFCGFENGHYVHFDLGQFILHPKLKYFFSSDI